jgi:salicylate hydroxylase
MAPLNVTIIGGGIAGFAAARALREKHNVTVLEQYAGGHEVGAALSMGPTATIVADSFGFDRTRCASVVAVASRSFNKDGKQIHHQDMSPFMVNNKADWLMQHRADLWNEWRRLATAPSAELGVQGEPAKVVWSADVVAVDVESGEVKLADGTVYHSDLVIGKRGCLQE